MSDREKCKIYTTKNNSQNVIFDWKSAKSHYNQNWIKTVFIDEILCFN